MPLFKYLAVNTKGETIEGNFAGTDQAQLLFMIREKQMVPVKVMEVVEKKDVSEIGIFARRVRIKDLAVFCRQFSTMLIAGVTIIKCLDILQQQTENKKLKAVTREVYQAVQKGTALSEAFKNHREVFPELLIYMVEAGEVSGSLDTIMQRMATHLEKENKIRNKVKGAMIYPAVLACVATLVVIFLLTFIMPMFIGMLTSSGIELPLPTRILLGISNALRYYWYLILPGVIIVAYFISKYFKSDAGRLFWDKLKLRIPVIKGCMQKIITGRFTRTLSTLLSSGMPLLQAMEVVSRVVNNRVAAEGIMQAREEMRRGMDMAGPIKRTGLFPPMVDSMIRIGEESGTLDNILESTANFYDEEVEAALQRLVSLLDPLMILIMAGIIGFIVISLAIPMFSMVDTIK